MKYLGYEVSVELNGTPFSGYPASFTYTLSDSIHDLLPRGSLGFPDMTGHFKDAGLMTDGFPLTLRLGAGDDAIALSLIVGSAEAGDPQTPGFLSGTSFFRLVHGSRLKMANVAKRYSGTISDTIGQVAQELGLADLDVEATQGIGPWWRAGVDQGRFLIETLRPNMISGDADGTPFFIFVDASGRLVAKSHAKMLGGLPQKTLLVAPRVISGAAGPDAQVFDARPFSEGFDASREQALPVLRGFSGETLEPITSEDSSFKHIGGAGNGVAMNRPEGPTAIVNLDRRFKGMNESYFWQARQNDRFRSIVCQERMLVTGRLDVTLRAGMSVDLKTYVPDPGSGAPMLGDHYNGRWLVERSTHSWLGPMKMGTSQLVLSRGKLAFSAESRLKAMVIS